MAAPKQDVRPRPALAARLSAHQRIVLIHDDA
jgi:hypothetical protein